MRRFAVLVAMLLAVAVAGCSSSSGPDEPDTLPEVTLQPLSSGEPVELSSLRGPLVVNLWASWCTPCKRELPQYQAFAEKYAGRVDVLGIDYQETRPAAARKLARDTGVDYPLLTDPDGDLRAVGLPKLILVDEDGTVAHEEYVEIESLAQLEGLVEKHLGVTA